MPGRKVVSDANGNNSSVPVTQVFAISATPTAITSGGAVLAGGGITLTATGTVAVAGSIK